MTTTSQADINTNSNAFISNGVAAGVGVGGNGNGGNSIADSNVSSNRTHNKNLNINTANNSSNNVPTGSSAANVQRAANDTGKRKKLKSRTASAPHTGYSKDHLDAWLETCLKDTSNTQLSSSSEFLDYNPTATNKNIFSQQQPPLQQMHSQQQQFHQQPQQQLQQQQSPLQQAYPLSNQQHFQQSQQQPQHQQQQQLQQQFAMRLNPQSPATSYATGYNAPFSQGLQQRCMPNFVRHSNSYNNRYSMMFPAVGGSGFYQQNDGAQEFASLPPIVNMMGGGSSEMENNSTDVLDGSGSNPNISRGFRFSDPCLLNPSDNDSKMSGQNTPDCRNQLPSELENNKFFSALMEQINLLHETNSKICRNLHETKVDIEALKHTPSWGGMRHRRDSLSGLSTHSQPMVFGGGFGTHSPAPTYHSGAYTPGMMTDVVREVKEAARVREDALLNRVKAMVEERQWSMNEGNLRMMRDIEELKSQIHHLRTDRKEANKRLTHLEAENKYMRQMLASIFNSRQAPDVIYENEALRTRKPLPHSRRSQSLNLHYGTIHHQPAVAPSLLLEEDDDAPLRIVETTASHVSTADVQQAASDMRSSFSSSDGGGIASAHSTAAHAATPLPNGCSSSGAGQVISPPSFALVSSPSEEAKRRKERLEKQPNITEERAMEQPQSATLELQQELSDAVAARKDADERIIALQSLVRNLQVHATTTHPADASHIPIANGVGLGHSVGGGSYTNNAGQAADAAATSAGSNSVLMKAAYNSKQPVAHWQQQQQQHSTYNGSSHNAGRQSQAHTSSSAATNVSMAQSHSPPKLSVAGPITDL